MRKRTFSYSFRSTSYRGLTSSCKGLVSGLCISLPIRAKELLFLVLGQTQWWIWQIFSMVYGQLDDQPLLGKGGVENQEDKNVGYFPPGTGQRSVGSPGKYLS